MESLQRAGVQMHWSSYYHKWIPQEHYYYAVEHTGFTANPERSEGTYSKYAKVWDDQLDGIHYQMAFIKFGIGRATSDAAHERFRRPFQLPFGIDSLTIMPGKSIVVS